MLGEFFGLLTAASFALADVFARKTMAGGTAFAGVYNSVIINLAILWPLALLLTDPGTITTLGIIFLVVAGVFSTTLGRLTRFIGIGKLGVSGSGPLVSSAPLFAATFAITVLGEVFTPILGLGTVLIVLGVGILSLSEWRVSRVGVIVSLGSSLFFGLAENFRKLGIEEVASPPFGGAVSASVALASYTLYSKATNTSTRLAGRPRLFSALAGVATTSGLLSSFTALSLADVVAVAPLFNTTPLFALLYVKLLLRRQERITLRVLVSALVVVAGVALIVTR